MVTIQVEFETPAGYTPTVKNTTADDKDSNGLTTTGVIKDADNMTLDRRSIPTVTSR